MKNVFLALGLCLVCACASPSKTAVTSGEEANAPKAECCDKAGACTEKADCEKASSCEGQTCPMTGKVQG